MVVLSVGTCQTAMTTPKSRHRTNKMRKITMRRLAASLRSG